MSLSSRLKDLPIHRKLIIIFFLATATAMFFVILVSTFLQWVVLREELIKNVSAQASIIASYSAAELASDNRTSAEKVVHSLEDIPNIEFAGILDKSGKDFALYVRPGVTMAPHTHKVAQNVSHLHNASYVEITFPVLLEQEQIGLIHVRSDMSPVYNKLKLNIIITLATAIGAFFIALMMLMRFLPSITRPLQYLVGLMQTVSKNNNFAVRAKLKGNDEMGALSKGFNAMLAQLQTRDEAIAQHHRHLEEEVVERTQELRKSNTQLEKELVERKRTEQELTNANEELSVLLDSLPIAVYRCLAEDDFAVLYMSHNVHSFTGFEPIEFMRQTNLWMSRIHPDDTAMIVTEMQQLFETGSDSYEYRWMNAAGTYIWILDSLRLIQPKDGTPAYMVGMWQDITERKQMELKLSESEERFRNVIELTTDWVWQVDKNGQYVYSGNKIRHLLGYEPQEIYGKTPFDFMPPEEADRVREIYEKIVSEQKAFSFLENVNLHKDGHRVILETSGVPLIDNDGVFHGYFGTEHDITERKNAEQALEESERKFRTILDVAVDGVLLMDEKQGKFILGNRAIYEMLGYGHNELYTLGIEDIHPKEALPEVFKEFERQRRGEILVSQNIPVMRKDGSVFVADVSSSPMVLSGRTIMVGFFHDVTERKRAEEEIRLLATTDSLTGIANRRAFSEQLEREVERVKRYGTPLSLIMYDIDFFKQVNDTYGHDVGDDVLQTLTAEVKKHIRVTDFVARWGGEEFMILMPESDISAAGEAAEKLRREVAAFSFNQIGSLTVSLGVTEFLPQDTINAVLKRVDDALYIAKESGRNRTEIL